MARKSSTNVDYDLEEPEMSDPGQIPISVFANDLVVQADLDVTIRDAAKQLADEGIGLLVLSDESGVRGVVSERDIVRAVASEVNLDAKVTAVSSVGAVQWASSNASLSEVANEMMRGWLRHILIADDEGNLVGIVSMRDLLAAIV